MWNLWLFFLILTAFSFLTLSATCSPVVLCSVCSACRWQTGRPSQRTRLLFPGAGEWAALGFCGCNTAVQRRVELGKKGHRERGDCFFFLFVLLKVKEWLNSKRLCLCRWDRPLHQRDLDAVSPAAQLKGESCKLFNQSLRSLFLAARCSALSFTFIDLHLFRVLIPCSPRVSPW